MREYLKKLIADSLTAVAEKHVEKISTLEFSLEPPPRPELGDYASNAAFLFAKQHGESPMRIADEMRTFLLSRKGATDLFEEITIAGGGFLNFKLSPKFLRENFAKFDPAKPRITPDGTIRDKKPSKKPGVVLVEYSSPNIGKPLSIAHIRSTIIGDALARIFRHLGYKVITDNHLGDWGLQTGILIAAYKLWGKKSARSLSMNELLELYVKFNTEMKEHDELAPKARMETVMLQSGDRKTLKIWKVFSQKSVRDYNRLYKILGVKFDYTLGESFYKAFFSKVISEVLKRGVAEKSQGAIVIPIDGKPFDNAQGKPPLIIQKNDGGYLYGTFDLATIKYRVKKWNPRLMLYVISNEQALYLEQMFKAAEKLGWIKPDQAVHIKFGLIRGEDMKRLSTRKGKAILLKNVSEEATRKARKIVEEKNPALPEREKEKISRMVGIGALKYNDLSQNRNTDIIFDWDRMLDLRGNSAPYLQYTYARLRSILRKIQITKSPPAPKLRRAGKLQKADLLVLTSPEELALMKKVMQFPESVEDTAKEYLPNLLANYLWELANLANTFYEKHQVLKAEKGLRAARLALISKTAKTLKTGLSLLGIEAPEQV